MAPSLRLPLLSGFLALLGHSVVGQDVIGVDVCGCSPSRYTFLFDFSLTCNVDMTGGEGVPTGEGVTSTSCVTSPFGNPMTTDLVPATVTQIDILELGQDVSVIVRETITGDFLDGDTFDYESITIAPEEITEVRDIPKAIQISLTALNAASEMIINVFILNFSNDCDQFPVLMDGQSAGWVHFVSQFFVFFSVLRASSLSRKRLFCLMATHHRAFFPHRPIW